MLFYLLLSLSVVNKAINGFSIVDSEINNCSIMRIITEQQYSPYTTDYKLLNFTIINTSYNSLLSSCFSSFHTSLYFKCFSQHFHSHHSKIYNHPHTFNYSDHPLTSTILSNVTHPLSNIPFSHSMSAHPLLVLRQPPFTTHIPMFHLPTAPLAIPTLSLLNPFNFFLFYHSSSIHVKLF